jgi:hypothetical protein
MPHYSFKSFNPYADRYPGRRVISRRALDLMKAMRAAGVDVIVTGNPSHEVNFLTQKGVKELLADPLFLLAVGIPINIVCGLLANALPQWFKTKNVTAADVVIEIDEGGRKARFTADGRPMDDTKFQALLSAMNQRNLRDGHTPYREPPFPARPIPIFLEHTDRVIGWGRVEVADDALFVRDALITDDDTLSKVKNRTLRGFSIGGLVRKATCGICSKSYFDCNHIGRETYDGKVCTVKLTKLDLVEISVVADPVNPDARIHFQGES